MINTMKKITFVITLYLFTLPSFAGQFFSSDGIAIEGYDTVAYFTENKARHGSENYALKWHGVTWQFSTAENLALFKSSPEKYVPQFGGYCALGAAHNGAVPTDPETFTIHKGKLYLNMAPPVGITWRLNPDFHIARASKSWQEGKIIFY
jgi:YHS domain-containing protein